MNIHKSLVSVFLLVAGSMPHTVFAVADAPSIHLSPATVIQGEPLFVTITGVVATSSVKTLMFDTKPVGVFLYQGNASALIGVDLHQKPGLYKVSATLSDGRVLEQEVAIGARALVAAPLGIPAKLGGNTATSQKALVTTLADENKILAQLRTGTKAFWTEKFAWPLAKIFVTDPYGYSRETGAYTIAHKGTDFRASEGTPVMAVNRGVVRLATELHTYGKTVVVDHGLGLMSFYMHLSKINVKTGYLVHQGDVIGLAGQTGYAESPHLHLSVRIGGTSIDPMKFYELFK